MWQVYEFYPNTKREIELMYFYSVLPIGGGVSVRDQKYNRWILPAQTKNPPAPLWTDRVTTVPGTEGSLPTSCPKEESMWVNTDKSSSYSYDH